MWVAAFGSSPQAARDGSPARHERVKSCEAVSREMVVECRRGRLGIGGDDLDVESVLADPLESGRYGMIAVGGALSGCAGIQSRRRRGNAGLAVGEIRRRVTENSANG